MIVGASGANEGEARSGAAYRFFRVGSRWVEEEKWVSPEPEKDGRFGSTVALWGDVAVVGAPGERYIVGRLYRDGGVAYVFARKGSQWLSAGTLDSNVTSAKVALGTSVALSPDSVVAAGRNIVVIAQ